MCFIATTMFMKISLLQYFRHCDLREAIPDNVGDCFAA